MNAKRLYVPIGLALMLLTVFLLPLMAWSGAQPAKAQDVGTAGAADAVITLTDVALQVGDTGVGTIVLSNTITPTLTEIEIRFNFPQDKVQVTNVTALTGTLDNQIIDNTGGQVFLSIQFDTPYSGTGAIVEVTYEGIAYTDTPEPLTFDRVEVVDDDGNASLLVSRKNNGQVTVDRPDIAVFIDQNDPTPPACEIEVGEILVTEVLAQNVYAVDRVTFEISFDPRFVQVNEVRPGSFFGASPLERDNFVDNTNGIIRFDYELSVPADALNAQLAEIEWEGYAAGTSPQAFVGDVRMYANGVEVVDPPTAITELDGCDIAVSPQEITIYLEPSDVQLEIDGGVECQDVKLRGVRKIDEVAFTLDYDGTLAQVVTPGGTPASEVQIGSLFGSSYLVRQNRVNTSLSQIQFSVDALDPIRQDGTVATICWKPLEIGGPSPLEFDFVELLTTDGRVPQGNITRENGTLTVGPGQTTAARVLIVPDLVKIDDLNETEPTRIRVEGVTNLSDANIEVAFDNSIVEVLSVEASTFGGNVTVTDVGNSSGVVEFTVSSMTAAAPNGPIAVITWKPVTTGTTDLVLQNVTLVEDGRDTIPTDLNDGVIEVLDNSGPGGTPTPTPTPDPDDGVSGVIEPQGSRPGYSGTSVELSVNACGSFSPSASTTTAGDGSFSFANGTSYGCLRATRTGYLSGIYSNPDGALGTLVLKAGDVNNDNSIDILDLAYVASKYTQADTVADYNGNGQVDILDISLVALNYNLDGPTNLFP